MAISFVNFNSNYAVTGPTVVVTKPTNTADNDILLAYGYCYNDVNYPPTMTLPDGTWTMITTRQLTDASHLAWWAWKRAASEGANYTFTSNASSQYLAAIVMAYRDCITSGAPYDQLNDTIYATSDLYIVAGGITPTVSPSMGVVMGVGRNVLTSGTVTAGWTERVDHSTTAFLYAAEKALSDTSATGDVTITAAGTATTSKHGILVNLKPAASPTSDRTSLVQFGIC